MNVSTLKKGLSSHRHTKLIFKDVVAANRLPTKNDSWGAYVVNTHPLHRKGEHWVVLKYTPQAVYYMDPYGLPPHPLIKKHLRKVLPRIPLYYREQRLQGPYPTCGLYCMYYILTLVSHHTLDVFADNYIFNDRLVRRLVRSEFVLKQ